MNPDGAAGSATQPSYHVSLELSYSWSFRDVASSYGEVIGWESIDCNFIRIDMGVGLLTFGTTDD